MTKIRCKAAAVMLAAAGASAALAQDDSAPRGGPLANPLPPVIVPAENPITEPKRVLGKVLFWDEQLSSDNTRSCGSCHFPEFGGTDPERFPNPGPDLQYGTKDDAFTSRGIIRALRDGTYDPDPVFGLHRQATRRTAPPTVFAAYFGEMFWDGRAGGEFVDPQTGESVIPFNGALESQAVDPVLSDVEMAHADRDWDEVAAKLERSVPLAIARDLPADLADALAAGPGYPDLFEAAFGDPGITARRIAFAIATYERTLVPDQTPWDLHVAGVDGAMTEEQIRGWQGFQGVGCAVCHSPPFFTDFNYQNIGLRPESFDRGRAEVTGSRFQSGAFKTSTLRNVGLKTSFFHNGTATTMDRVIEIYTQAFVPDSPNRSLFLPLSVPLFERGPIAEFVLNGLTDPRVANETFPFDRPLLYSEWGVGNPAVLAGGRPGAGGEPPRIIAESPPFAGNLEFKIGLASAPAGAPATLVRSPAPPVAGEVQAGEVVFETVAAPHEVEGGHATWIGSITGEAPGDVQYYQWRVADEAAFGGVALSPPVRVEVVAPRADVGCRADLALPSGVLDLADVQAFVAAFSSEGAEADLAAPFGVIDLADVQAFVGVFTAGCP